jgi:hypothetical protein
MIGTIMGQSEMDDYALGMYSRTNVIWNHNALNLFNGECGFSILSGPPIFRPEILFIGNNPGFGADDHQPHVEKHWPEESYLSDPKWKFARKICSIFGSNNEMARQRAIQTNFLFFKSSSISKKSRYRWNDLPHAFRNDLQVFCDNELKGFVQVSMPNTIVVLGLGGFDNYATDCKEILRDRSGKRRLLVEGRLFGRQAHGIPHPTGSHIATEDWNRVTRRMLCGQILHPPKTSQPTRP